jgi:ribosomal protein S2
LDVDPCVVTYPIPANDDSVRSIELIAGILARAGQEGLQKRAKLSVFLVPSSFLPLYLQINQLLTHVYLVYSLSSKFPGSKSL